MRFAAGLMCGVMLGALVYLEWGVPLPDVSRDAFAWLRHLDVRPDAQAPAQPGVEPDDNTMNTRHDTVMPAADVLPEKAAAIPADAAPQTLVLQTPAAQAPDASATPRAAPAPDTPAPITPPAANQAELPTASDKDPQEVLVLADALADPPVDTAAAPMPAAQSAGSAVVWDRFRSEATARGFAGFMAARTGRSFRVQALAMGQYAVVYEYADAQDLQTTLRAVTQLARGGVAL